MLFSTTTTTSSNTVISFGPATATTNALRNWWFHRMVNFTSRRGDDMSVQVSFDLMKKFETGRMVGAARGTIKGTDVSTEVMCFEYEEGMEAEALLVAITHRLAQQCIDIFNIMEEMEVETKGR